MVDSFALAGRAETGIPTAIVEGVGLVLPWLDGSGENSGGGEETFGDLVTPGIPSEYQLGRLIQELPLTMSPQARHQSQSRRSKNGRIQSRRSGPLGAVRLHLCLLQVRRHPKI